MDKPSFPNRTRRSPNSRRTGGSFVISPLPCDKPGYQDAAKKYCSSGWPWTWVGRWVIQMMETREHKTIMAWSTTHKVPEPPFWANTLSLSLYDCPQFPVSKMYINVCVCMYIYIQNPSLVSEECMNMATAFASLLHHAGSGWLGQRTITGYFSSGSSVSYR